MTEKDITRIAEATAKIVIDHIEAKQDEWNNEFEINLNEFNVNHTLGRTEIPDEKQLLETTILELEKQRTKAIADEDYLLASKINAKIIDLKTKLK
jgi:hypothetical protein|tara:strand:+ start:356 stop:643 length:288 start_codon:yes stop_codon:yes gene_type:complete